MNKKIVILTGSPRRHGNSSVLADALTEGLEKNGNKVLRFDTAFMNIGGCRACQGCYSKGTPCIFNQDDFNTIASKIETADGLIIATPVYWFSFPAQIKAAIDRFYSFLIGKHLFTGKKCALISCCADQPLETFDPVISSYRESIALLQGENIGEILFPGISKVGDIKNTNMSEKLQPIIHAFQ